MSNKILILFKAVKTNGSSFGQIYNMTKTYCDNYRLKELDFNYFFIIEDPCIDERMVVHDNNIYVKTKSDNYLSLLIKVIVSLKHFYNSDYTHIMVANVSTFINIKKILELTNGEHDCIGNIGHYCFNDVSYNFMSGAGYIIPIKIVRELCDFVDAENFIDGNNNVSKEFIDKYTGKNNDILTDDIFIGYYLHTHNYKIIEKLNRICCYKQTNVSKIPTNADCYRVKTMCGSLDKECFKYLCLKIYGLQM